MTNDPTLPTDEPRQPRTEAGRALLAEWVAADKPIPEDRAYMAAAILAIEAEARAQGALHEMLIREGEDEAEAAIPDPDSGGLREALRAWALQMANAAAESGRRETKPEKREWHRGAEHIADGLLTWIGDHWPDPEPDPLGLGAAVEAYDAEQRRASRALSDSRAARDGLLREALRIVDNTIVDLTIGNDVTYSRGYAAGIAAARESFREGLRDALGRGEEAR